MSQQPSEPQKSEGSAELKAYIIDMLCSCDVKDSGYVTKTRYDYDLAAEKVTALIRQREAEADKIAMFREARHRATDAIDRLWRLDKDACREFLKTYVKGE